MPMVYFVPGRSPCFLKETLRTLDSLWKPSALELTGASLNDLSPNTLREEARLFQACPPHGLGLARFSTPLKLRLSVLAQSTAADGFIGGGGCPSLPKSNALWLLDF